MNSPSAELQIYLAMTQLGMSPNEVMETDAALIEALLQMDPAYKKAEYERHKQEQKKQK